VDRWVGINPRGVGNSSPVMAHRDTTFLQHVEDLEAVRKQLSIERWVFWGSSGGGAIALLYALEYPQSLSGLIVERMGASGVGIVGDPSSNLSPQHPDWRDLVAATSSSKDSSETESPEWVQSREDAFCLNRGNQPLVVSSPSERIRTGMFEVATACELLRLGEIQLPTLVIGSRLDQTIPMQLELVHKGIPHSEFLVLEESGHNVEPESADGKKRQAAVEGFLAKIADASR
jgi:proline iminopeptidase